MQKRWSSQVALVEVAGVQDFFNSLLLLNVSNKYVQLSTYHFTNKPNNLDSGCKKVLNGGLGPISNYFIKEIYLFLKWDQA